jgi:hypothetical protein
MLKNGNFKVNNIHKSVERRALYLAIGVSHRVAKAFRGELGTNNPDDENSVELLKRMIEGVDNK